METGGDYMPEQGLGTSFLTTRLPVPIERQGNGDGTFPYNSGALVAFSVVITDVNGDGKPDLLAANPCPANNCYRKGTSVNVLLGIGDGTFQKAVNYYSGGTFDLGRFPFVARSDILPQPCT